MNITSELTRKVSSFLSTRNVAGGTRILTGFSGGPDSTVLLHILTRLRSSFGYDLAALYIDHGIRRSEVMKAECLSVSVAAEKMAVPLDIVHIPQDSIATAASRDKKSLEETAREYRYRIFSQVMAEKEIPFLALGHTLDDTVETLIMRIFQGSGIHGLTGISQTAGSIIRPLGQVEKKSIIDYIRENNLSPVRDETNNQSVYLRNKIRNKLIPEIREIFPGYKKSLLTMSRKMKMAGQYIEERSGNVSRFVGDQGTLRLSRGAFDRLHPYEKMEILYQSWDSWPDRPRRQLGFKNIKPLIDGKLPKRGGAILSGPGYCLQYVDNSFTWKRLVVSLKKSYLRVVNPGRYVVPSGMVIEVVSTDLCSEETTWVYADLVRGPLLIRSKKPGDFIAVKDGKKSLKKLFGEWKVPENDRWKIPLVSDRSGVLLVLGGELGYKDRVAVRQKKTGRIVPGKKIVFSTYMEK